MEKNPLLKYLIKEKKEDVVHSTGYGVAQNEGGFGTASAKSFANRQDTEANRSMVGGYKDSKIARESRAEVPLASGYNAARETAQREAIRQRFGRDSERKNPSSMRSGGMGKNDQSSGGFRGSSLPGSVTQSGGHEGMANPPARRNPGISR